jgi:copper chaperone CopZ
MKNQTAEWSIGSQSTRFGRFPLFGLVLTVCIFSTGCESRTTPELAATGKKSDSTYVSQEAVASPDESTAKEVAVRIDTMMCVAGCFNSVKELLEKRPGIEEVRLAPQKEEGTIDNSMIYIKHRGELDAAEIERLILGAGFDKMEFVKQD